MKVLEILELFDFYRDSEPHLRKEIAAYSNRKTLEHGEFFFREGDVCSVFAMLGSGSLRVFKIGESGREITLYRVTSGQTCLGNMVSSFLDVGSPAFAIAEEAIEAAVVPARYFRTWLSKNPAMQRYVFEGMAARLLGVMTLIEEVVFRKMDTS
ncbi:MAG: Crp/Fnr family transcriptional regulator [bacterium]